MQKKSQYYTRKVGEREAAKGGLTPPQLVRRRPVAAQYYVIILTSHSSFMYPPTWQDLLGKACNSHVWGSARSTKGSPVLLH